MAEPRPKENKKAYHPPAVQFYGDIAKITAAQNTGANMDSGVFPMVKTA